ncbi:MAG: ATP-binding cassette domain-containing protein [Bacteroidales bacterium]|nr:ATP-binding cassette domain-containing protein [Bacteroidales bacterium]
MALFRARNIVKKFATQTALDDVSITVPEGGIYGLLGPNGAGKTTLLRIINQITAPDSGDLLFKGRKLVPDDVFNIGYLPEERGLYKKMKVGEQAMYLAQLKGLSKKEASERLKYWFARFEIMAWWNKKVEELSRGMQQKVQFIITILHNPSLLIFDEPFSGFDPINTEMLKKEILIKKEEGATIIFSTHNMESVEELCDHITLIDNGKKLLEGEIHKIRQKYRTNVYEVEFAGDIQNIEKALNNKYDLFDHQVENDHNKVKIQVSNPKDNNELIALIIPEVRIISFNEALPSMNDIFIRVVKEGQVVTT